MLLLHLAPEPTPPTSGKRTTERSTKNIWEMIKRVRSYALKHGISIKEFRKTVMDFKAKLKVTGEEFDPKYIFKMIKDKIEQIKRGKLLYYQIIISVILFNL